VVGVVLTPGANLVAGIESDVVPHAKRQGMERSVRGVRTGRARARPRCRFQPPTSILPTTTNHLPGADSAHAVRERPQRHFRRGGGQLTTSERVFTRFSHLALP
jgi:hypothetical protein